MDYQLLLPRMGEGISEATIVKWLKQPGDQVDQDEIIIEIATDKVDSEIPSPVSGKLLEHRFSADQVAQVGDVLAVIVTEASEASEPDKGTVAGPASVDESTAEREPERKVEERTQAETIPGMDQLSHEPVRSGLDLSGTDRFYSPLIKSIAAEEGVSVEELESISGTGSEGRLTKQDLLQYLENRANGRSDETVAENNESKAKQEKSNVREESFSITSGQDEIIEMDRMRRLIADHMVHSVQTSPHVCSFVEADVTNIVNWRNKVKKSFESREGEKLTFTPVFIEAVAKAIKDFPLINISVSGTQIIKKRAINIGMAAALPNGNLIVPVIKNADQLNLVGLTRKVNDLAGRARESRLKPEETQGGTFTLTNIGSFGNIMGMPIINQPQVAIMAVGTIKKKPAVIETEYGDVIAIRHMMYLSMSYDHRVVDGALGGMFIRRVADYLEAWDGEREL